MTRLQKQLIEFHRAFDHPIQPHPSILRDERVRLRAALIVEECLEFVESVFDPYGRLIEGDSTRARDELAIARRALQLIITNAYVKVDLVEAADALADIDYVVEGTRLEFGINGGPIADEVHRSNLAKLGGKKSPEGKTLKPAGWTPPDIKGCLAAQEASSSEWSIKRLLDGT